MSSSNQLRKFLIFSLVLAHICVTSCRKDNPRIAIVGAGIGGASSAYHLRELFGDEVEIDVYEKGKVGGRMATINVDGKEYESGGSVMHPQNEYMVNFTRMLGLKPRDGSPGGRLGIFDGEKMVFDGSSYELLMVAQLMWRYGLDLYRIQKYVSDMMSHFKGIYPAQEAGQCFTTPEKMLSHMAPGFPDKLHHSVAEEMEYAHISQRFTDELVTGAMRTNYGQGSDINGFVGGVSMAGVEPGLWQVHGGNRLIPEKLLERSKINLIKSKVVKVTLKAPEGQTKYTLVSEDAHNPKKITKKEYDIVIIASPLHSDMTNIKFEAFPGPIGNFPQKFHRTVGNFVKGVPRASTFGLPNPESFPTELLTTSPDLYFNSIGQHLPVTYSKAEESADIYTTDGVYKVFSQKPLDKTELDTLFVSYDKVEVVDWLAYPHYSSNEKNIPPFELFHQLYYVSSIELCASAIEMSSIAGRNVALLAYNHWRGNLGLVNPKPKTLKKNHTEL